MRPTLKTTISYVDCPLPAPDLKFHPTIAQSILNLLNNAADASPEFVEVNIRWTDIEIEIQIKDIGDGFDSTNIDRPFFSSKAEGLGLGLFLSQSTVTRFGGSVNLQNLTDGGTLTTMSLPLDLTVKAEAIE
jgi:two-component system sensor histidine kinase RegB